MTIHSATFGTWTRYRGPGGQLISYAIVTFVIVGLFIAGTLAFSEGSVLSCVGVLVAAWCSAVAWRKRERTRPNRRSGWSAIALGAALSTISLGSLFAFETGVMTSPSRFVTHATMLAGLAAIGFGGVVLGPKRRIGTDSIAVVLDLVIVMSVFSLLAWSAILEPVFRFPARDASAALAASAHVVVSGIVLIASLVVAFRSSPGGSLNSVAMLPSVCAGLAVADLFWTATWIDDAKAARSFGDASVVISFTVLALILARDRRRPNHHETPDSRATSETGSHALWRCWAACPLAIALLFETARTALSDQRTASAPIVIAGALTTSALVVLRLVMEVTSTRRMMLTVSERIDRDPLTGLINHRRFGELLALEIEGREATKRPLTMALVDVDQFKLVNDRFGHLAGDHVLRAIAAALIRSCRTTDIVARYAGDEFAIMLIDVDGDGAEAIGERILREVLKLSLWAGDDAERPIGVSIGFAVTNGRSLESIRVIAAADEALYRSKENGRNRYTIVDVQDVEFSSTLDPRRLLVAHPAY